MFQVFFWGPVIPSQEVFGCLGYSYSSNRWVHLGSARKVMKQRLLKNDFNTNIVVSSLGNRLLKGGW